MIVLLAKAEISQSDFSYDEQITIDVPDNEEYEKLVRKFVEMIESTYEYSVTYIDKDVDDTLIKELMNYENSLRKTYNEYTREYTDIYDFALQKFNINLRNFDIDNFMAAYEESAEEKFLRRFRDKLQEEINEIDEYLEAKERAEKSISEAKAEVTQARGFIDRIRSGITSIQDYVKAVKDEVMEAVDTMKRKLGSFFGRILGREDEKDKDEKEQSGGRFEGLIKRKKLDVNLSDDDMPKLKRRNKDELLKALRGNKQEPEKKEDNDNDNDNDHSWGFHR